MNTADVIIRPHLDMETNLWSVTVATGMTQGRTGDEHAIKVRYIGPTAVQGLQRRKCMLGVLQKVCGERAPSLRNRTTPNLDHMYGLPRGVDSALLMLSHVAGCLRDPSEVPRSTLYSLEAQATVLSELHAFCAGECERYRQCHDEGLDSEMGVTLEQYNETTGVLTTLLARDLGSLAPNGKGMTSGVVAFLLRELARENGDGVLTTILTDVRAGGEGALGQDNTTDEEDRAGAVEALGGLHQNDDGSGWDGGGAGGDDEGYAVNVDVGGREEKEPRIGAGREEEAEDTRAMLAEVHRKRKSGKGKTCGLRRRTTAGNIDQGGDAAANGDGNDGAGGGDEGADAMGAPGDVDEGGGDESEGEGGGAEFDGTPRNLLFGPPQLGRADLAALEPHDDGLAPGDLGPPGRGALAERVLGWGDGGEEAPGGGTTARGGILGGNEAEEQGQGDFDQEGGGAANGDGNDGAGGGDEGADAMGAPEDVDEGGGDESEGEGGGGGGAESDGVPRNLFLNPPKLGRANLAALEPHDDGLAPGDLGPPGRGALAAGELDWGDGGGADAPGGGTAPGGETTARGGVLGGNEADEQGQDDDSSDSPQRKPGAQPKRASVRSPTTKEGKPGPKQAAIANDPEFVLLAWHCTSALGEHLIGQNAELPLITA